MSLGYIACELGIHRGGMEPGPVTVWDLDSLAVRGVASRTVVHDLAVCLRCGASLNPRFVVVRVV